MYLESQKRSTNKRFSQSEMTAINAKTKDRRQHQLLFTPFPRFILIIKAENQTNTHESKKNNGERMLARARTSSHKLPEVNIK